MVRTVPEDQRLDSLKSRVFGNFGFSSRNLASAMIRSVCSAWAH